MLPDKLPFQEIPEINPKIGAGCSYLILAGILLSILSSMALLTFIRQASEEKQQRSEGKTYVGSINRSQQAFFLENATFANSIKALDIGISPRTELYSYLVGTQSTQPPIAVTLAVPAQEGLKGYIGIVSLQEADLSATAILCETEADISADFPMPLPFPTASMECPAGFVKR